MISNDIEKVLVTEEQIIERCKELAQEIQADYDKEEKYPLWLAY